MTIALNQGIIMVTIIFFILMGTGFLFWNYMWEGEILGKWASVVTIFSLIGIPITYFAKQNQKDQEREQAEKAERDKASRNLHGELKDALEDGLNDKKYPDSSITMKYEEEGKTITIFYMSRRLNHDIYDSLISSGKINFLTHELQQEVQDIFKRIKDHNYYLRYTREMEDDLEENVSHPKAIKYYKWMYDSENILLKIIPDMMKKLEKDFDI